jgi:tRNA-2-methylthio-N6-dimethylallyladenosine synthase
MKYLIFTYGCQMNESDSERIGSILKENGLIKTSNIKEADFIFANMCSVRQPAVDRIFGKAKQFKEFKVKNPKLKTILTGCILEKDKKKLISGYDFILDIKDLEKWPAILGLNKKKIDTKSHYLEIKPDYSNKFSASIPITFGCDNFCSYCVVPHSRGREVSRPAEKILNEAESLIEKGYKEIWFLGQNVNSYKSKLNGKEIGFAELIKTADKIPGDFWIRFTSSHPKDFSKKLIKAISRAEKVTNYLNLPIQSGDSRILKRMNRPYTARQYKYLIKNIRKEIPDISLSTDIIVGFPGETKKQFQNTAKLMKEIKYDMAYILKYSPRSGTEAEKMKDSVSKEEKMRIFIVLNNILKKTALEKNKKMIDRETIALIDGKGKNNEWLGKTRNYKTIKITCPSAGGKDILGKFIEVKITKAFPWGLEGRIKKPISNETG